MNHSSFPKDAEIPNSYSRFLELIGENARLQAKISQHTKNSNSFIRSDQSFSELLEDEFQDTGKLHRSNEDTIESHLHLNEGLYTFTKESSINTSHIRNESNYSQKHNEGNINQIDTNKEKSNRFMLN